MSPRRNTLKPACITSCIRGRTLAGLAAALAVADPCRSAARRAPATWPLDLADARSRLDDFGRALARGASEHDEVEKAVGAEPVGAMHRNASRFADRHQAGHDCLGVSSLSD